MDDSYLYPRDSMSSEATMRMSLNSLDSTATSSGSGVRAHTNWAFAASTPELDSVVPTNMPAKDSRFSRAKSPPPPPKDKPPRLDSPAVGSTSVARHTPGSLQFDAPRDLPPASLPPQTLRSVSAFQPSLSESTGNVKNASLTGERASAPLPKSLECNKGVVAAGSVQLRSKPSVRRPGDDRDRSHLYEELPWSERELAAAAAAACSDSARATPLDDGITVKERRRTNPLYGPRMPNDTLPPKPDVSVAGAHQDADTAAMKREQRRQCIAFSAVIVAVAAVSIAALVLAIVTPAGRTFEGYTVVFNGSGNTTDLQQRLVSLHAAVASLQAKVEMQQQTIDDYSLKLNITAQAFTKCSIARTRSVSNEQATEIISDTSAYVVFGVFCNSGSLTTTISVTATNATVNSYRCLCFNASAGCDMYYSVCPTRLF